MYHHAQPTTKTGITIQAMRADPAFKGAESGRPDTPRHVGTTISPLSARPLFDEGAIFLRGTSTRSGGRAAAGIHLATQACARRHPPIDDIFCGTRIGDQLRPA